MCMEASSMLRGGGFSCDYVCWCFFPPVGCQRHSVSVPFNLQRFNVASLHLAFLILMSVLQIGSLWQKLREMNLSKNSSIKTKTTLCLITVKTKINKISLSYLLDASSMVWGVDSLVTIMSCFFPTCRLSMKCLCPFQPTGIYLYRYMYSFF